MRPLLVLLLLGCSAPPAIPASPPAQIAPITVVLISLDGFRHDYPERADTPHIDRLAREGVRAGRLLPPFPSLTFPGHASLATGAWVGRHGIVANRFLDRERGLFDYDDAVSWYDVVPLWIHAERHGVRTQIFHWIGSRGAWQGVRPQEARPFDKAIGDDEKIETILEWLRAPVEARPRLIMSYLRGCDHVGHHQGPGSQAVVGCVREADARIGRLVAGLRAIGRPIALLVVSDHGMTRTLGELDPAAPFAAAGVEARVVTAGPIAHVFTDRGAEALAVARQIPHVAQAHARGALPVSWHYEHPTRTGDVVLLAEPGWRFTRNPKGPLLPGHHGHPPDMPDMGAFLLAWGAGVRPGARLPIARAIDVVPTICRLLAIPPPAAIDGRALEEILAIPP